MVSIIQRYTGGGNGSIGYSAHIAGGVAGILIGMNVLRNFHHKVIFLRCKKSKISIKFSSAPLFLEGRVQKFSSPKKINK